MIGESFEKPTVRENVLETGIKLPKNKNVCMGLVKELMQEGKILHVGYDFPGTVSIIRNQKDDQVLYFPEKFRIPKEEIGKRVKSLESFLKIDSEQVLDSIEPGTRKLTREFLQKNRIWPVTLIKKAIKFYRENDLYLDNPPLGFYWRGLDGHNRGVMWLGSEEGVDMKCLKDKKKFQIRPVDLTKLSLHKIGDINQFSDWVDMEAWSTDEDFYYTSKAHDKFKFGLCIFTGDVGCTFFDYHSRTKKGPKRIRINPFPIPTEYMVECTDKLRLRAIIKERDCNRLLVLNKKEINQNLGAITASANRYDDCWFHWGKVDLDYVTKP